MTAVQSRHPLRLGQPRLQLGVLDQRPARARAARRGGRRLLPPLVRQLPRRPTTGRRRRPTTPVQHHGAARSAAAGRRRLPITGLYNLNPDKVGQVDNYTTFARDFGKQIEHWNGVDVSVNARLQNGLRLQGGVSTGRTTTDNCEIAANVRRESQPALLPRRHELPDAGQAARHLHRCRRSTSGRGDVPEHPGPGDLRRTTSSPTRWCSRRSAVRCRAAPPT